MLVVRIHAIDSNVKIFLIVPTNSKNYTQPQLTEAIVLANRLTEGW